MKVLLQLDHAPDYRESFLRKLGEKCDLIVVANSCERDFLTPPTERSGYLYFELKNNFGNKIRLNFDLKKIIDTTRPDVICVSLNLRYPVRVLTFLFYKRLRNRWIWWGQIFGKNDNAFLLRLKKYLIKKSKGALVYTKEIKSKLKGLPVFSFDNSQFSENDFVRLPCSNNPTSRNFLFVGRPQPRKRLLLILQFAKKYPNHNFRLVGPEMECYFKEESLPVNLSLYSAAKGKDLEEHFLWSNIVLNPGHVGLLVMNAATHNRAIAIDSKVVHAPEVILAKKAGQFFVDFLNEEEISTFFEKTVMDHNELITKAKSLYDCAIGEFTIEKMAEKHYSCFLRTYKSELRKSFID